MGRFSGWILVLAAIAASAGRTQAQTYVGGSVVTDVVRMSGLRGGIGPDQSGETFGGAIRVGAAITERWGVDLEFVRTGEIESRLGANILAAQQALTTSLTFIGITTGTTGSTTALSTLFPGPEYTTTRQTSTVSTMLWARQQLGSRADIVYLGGAAFTRTSRKDHIEFFVPRILPPPIDGFDSEYLFYGAGAIVGTDVRVRMTDHVRLVPGVRLQITSTDEETGLIVRPAVGIQWMF